MGSKLSSIASPYWEPLRQMIEQAVMGHQPDSPTAAAAWQRDVRPVWRACYAHLDDYGRAGLWERVREVQDRAKAGEDMTHHPYWAFHLYRALSVRYFASSPKGKEMRREVEERRKRNPERIKQCKAARARYQQKKKAERRGETQ